MQEEVALITAPSGSGELGIESRKTCLPLKGLFIDAFDIKIYHELHLSESLVQFIKALKKESQIEVGLVSGGFTLQLLKD